MRHLPLYGGLAPLDPSYSGYVCDLWGVLHDGVAAFPAAIDCLRELKRRSRRIAVLSNAPRRALEVEHRMNELGIAPELYDFVHSSGEATWRELVAPRDPWFKALGERYFHLGPERDHGMREGLPQRRVEQVEAADFVLLTGACGSEDRVEDYLPVLEKALERGLPMVCANPDLEVIRGGRREICGGAIAERYGALGGDLRYRGKPDPAIYDDCLAALGLPPGEVAALGDSLRTDMAGAEAAGIDGIFVLGGIHAETLGIAAGGLPSPERLESLCAERGVWPKAALPWLSWNGAAEVRPGA